MARRERTESGYVLAVVLGILATATLIVAALLSLTLNSTSLMSSQVRNSRQERAANGALETAVNQIRTDPTGALGSTDPCDAGVGSVNVGGVTSTVECVVTPSNPAAPPVAATVSGSTNGLTVIGSSYGGTIPWTTDCPITGTGPAPGPGCFPWLAALGPSNFATYGSQRNAYAGTLLHSGPKSLRLTGDVKVKQGAAALRNPTDGNPAIEVGGSYQQGVNGLFSAVTGSDPCGISGYVHPWNIGGARITDLTSGPECGVAAVAGIGDSSALAAPAYSFTSSFVTAMQAKTDAWMAAGVTSSPVTTYARTVPTCSGTVLTFEPGSYNRIETAKLNGYLASSSDGCDGKTFWFKPGDYWFDSGNADNSITFADPSARVVFGEPIRAAIKTSGANVGDFPKACDPTKEGVSITLSPRTSIRHLAGRVAICDRDTGSDAGTRPAIWQTAATDGGWSGYVGDITSFSGLTRSLIGGVFGIWIPQNGANLAAARLPDGSFASISGECGGGVFCEGDLSMTATGLGTLRRDGSVQPDPGPAPIRSAQILLTANAHDLNDMSVLPLQPQTPATTAVQLYLRQPDGTVSNVAGCGGKYQSINQVPEPKKDEPPIPPSTVAFDLIRDNPDPVNGLPLCRSVISDRSQLYGATIRVLFHTNTKGDYRTLQVDGIGIRTANSLPPAATTGSLTSPMENAAQAAVADGSYARTIETCGYLSGCPSRWRDIVMTGIEDVAVPSLASSMTDGLTSAVVIVQGGESNNGSWGITFTGDSETWLHSRIRFVLSDLKDGQTCAVEYPRPPLWDQRTVYDLLVPTALSVDGYSKCGAVLRSPNQLIGATLTTSIYLERDGWYPGDTYGYLIDYVGLSYTSGPYTQPTSSNVITSNATSSGDGASFNVYGSISTSRNNWDVHWAGPATQDPVVYGSMVVRSLGSDMTPTADTTTLCCAPTRPSERRVQLSAYVDGNLRGSALVRISDQDGGAFSPGRAAVVEDWRLCRAPGSVKTCPDP